MSRSRWNSGKRWRANGSRFHRRRREQGTRYTGGYFLSRLIPSEIDSPVKKNLLERRNDQRERARELWTTNDLPLFLSLFFLFSFSLLSFFPFFYFSIREIPRDTRAEGGNDPSESHDRCSTTKFFGFLRFRLDTPLSGVSARLIVSYSIPLHYGGSTWDNYTRNETESYFVPFLSTLFRGQRCSTYVSLRTFIRFALIATIRGKTWNNSFTVPHRPET